MPYAARFMTSEGRVVDHANGDISHSEGQGYAMLLAERVGDRDRFDRLWRWTQSNLYVGDSSPAAWRWDPKSLPHITDDNNATDGDLMIAWVLTEAAAKWQRPMYVEAARRIEAAIANTVIISKQFGPLLMPARKGFAAGEQVDGPVINLSYWIFPALDAMQRLSPTGNWAAVASAGELLISAAHFGPRALPSNWVSVVGNTPTPARPFPPLFGYDAVRVPLYAAWGDVSP